MSDKIHYCDVCGISSEEKRVKFIKNANMYLCRKHREQFMKFGEFKDSNKRGVFDPNEVRILKDYAEKDSRFKVIKRDTKGGTAATGIEYSLPYCKGKENFEIR